LVQILTLEAGTSRRSETSGGLVMEPTVGAVAGSEAKSLGLVVQIDDGKIRTNLDEVVRATVEETLNALLDAEADFLCGVGKYERTEGRKDTRAGSYEPLSPPRLGR
jgi:Transposase, Mutator family